jgi:hypothetical protein
MRLRQPIDGLLPTPYGARPAELDEVRVKQTCNFTRRIPSFLPKQLLFYSSTRPCFASRSPVNAQFKTFDKTLVPGRSVAYVCRKIEPELTRRKTRKLGPPRTAARFAAIELLGVVQSAYGPQGADGRTINGNGPGRIFTFSVLDPYLALPERTAFFGTPTILRSDRCRPPMRPFASA